MIAVAIGLCAGGALLCDELTFVQGGRASARAFLAHIYEQYRLPNGDGVLIDRPEQWFEPRLARAMRDDDDDAARRQEVGTLDRDPFCDCQDFEPFTAKIGPITVSKSTARAVARFRNGGPITLVYDLVATPAGWRIRDITWPEGHLRRLFLKRG
jgi:hypothetical protein